MLNRQHEVGEVAGGYHRPPHVAPTVARPGAHDRLGRVRVFDACAGADCIEVLDQIAAAQRCQLGIGVENESGDGAPAEGHTGRSGSDRRVDFGDLGLDVLVKRFAPGHVQHFGDDVH